MCPQMFSPRWNQMPCQRWATCDVLRYLRFLFFVWLSCAVVAFVSFKPITDSCWVAI